MHRLQRASHGNLAVNPSVVERQDGTINAVVTMCVFSPHLPFTSCRERERESERERLIEWTLFLNGEDISTKADSHICRCYSTTNNQGIHSQILWQKGIDKYSISKKYLRNEEKKATTHIKRDSDRDGNDKEKKKGKKKERKKKKKSEKHF